MKKQIKPISPVLNGICVHDWKKQRLFNSRVNLARARCVSNCIIHTYLRTDKFLLEECNGNVNAVINRLNGRKKLTVGELFEQQIAKIKKSDLGQTYKTHLIKNLRQVAGENRSWPVDEKNGHLRGIPHSTVHKFIMNTFTWDETKQKSDYWSNVYLKLQSKNI